MTSNYTTNRYGSFLIQTTGRLPPVIPRASGAMGLESSERRYSKSYAPTISTDRLSRLRLQAFPLGKRAHCITSKNGIYRVASLDGFVLCSGGKWIDSISADDLNMYVSSHYIQFGILVYLTFCPKAKQEREGQGFLVFGVCWIGRLRRPFNEQIRLNYVTTRHRYGIIQVSKMTSNWKNWRKNGKYRGRRRSNQKYRPFATRQKSRISAQKTNGRDNSCTSSHPFVPCHLVDGRWLSLQEEQGFQALHNIKKRL